MGRSCVHEAAGASAALLASSSSWFFDKPTRLQDPVCPAPVSTGLQVLAFEKEGDDLPQGSPSTQPVLVERQRTVRSLWFCRVLGVGRSEWTQTEVRVMESGPQDICPHSEDRRVWPH